MNNSLKTKRTPSIEITKHTPSIEIPQHAPSIEIPQRKPAAMKHHFSVPRSWLIAIIAILTIPWVVVSIVYLQNGNEAPAQSNIQYEAQPRPKVYRPPVQSAPVLCAEGPWGILERTDIIISPPSEFISEMSADRVNSTWHFPKMAKDDIQPFLEKCGLSEAQRKALVDCTHYDGATGDYHIKPPAPIVDGLTPEARAALYHYLGSYDVNSNIEAAFRFTGTAEEWSSRSRLSKRFKDGFRQKIYSNGSTLFFADVPSVLALTENVDEQRRALKMMSRNKTPMLKLKVDENSNIEELINYWGKGGRANDIRPMLESMASMPGGQEIDLVHLLPPFARQRLYKYAIPSMESASKGRNCYWTAMNFFEAIPDDRFTELSYVAQVIGRDYMPIYGNPQFGDIIFFGKSEKEILHAAVFIADDIVFTKNGSLETRPWMFMHLDQMKEYYPIPKEKLWMKYYRHKGH